ncbi:MAG: hypothetical protein JRF64_04310 [Deltaproteobacteria bacterium]|jgi:hypothetical protein|nr:hypothetical protein [Deltaproteobacteria bacterium]
MRKLLVDKDNVFQLQEHAVWQNEDGSNDYMAWDTKPDKLSWYGGKAVIIEDVLCLTAIASEGEEENFKSVQEVELELNKLPKWDKTKYYCVVIAGSEATLIKYCETGKPLESGEADFNAAKEMLQKEGVRLLSG